MTTDLPERADFVVVANRLPVDRAEDGEWRRSPGGLVTALEPMMRRADGAWVGWPGQADLELEPFEFEGTHLVPIALSAEDVELYYEGFSNDTIWPLYHDVIAAPRYSRVWWEAYVRVNRRFAEATAAVAAAGATVWVQDYQLQLVPTMLRDLRPDERRHCADDRCVDSPAVAEQRHRAGRERDDDRRSGEEEHRAGNGEERRRAADEEVADVQPPVAGGQELRLEPQRGAGRGPGEAALQAAADRRFPRRAPP